MSDVQHGPCEECGEEITIRADECNHCGHNPGQKQYYGPLFCIILGSLLSILIITAIIGVPLVLIGIVWAVWVWYKSDNPMPIDDEYLEQHAI